MNNKELCRIAIKIKISIKSSLKEENLVVKLILHLIDLKINYIDEFFIINYLFFY